MTDSAGIWVRHGHVGGEWTEQSTHRIVHVIVVDASRLHSRSVSTVVFYRRLSCRPPSRPSSSLLIKAPFGRTEEEEKKKSNLPQPTKTEPYHSLTIIKVHQTTLARLEHRQRARLLLAVRRPGTAALLPFWKPSSNFRPQGS